MRPQIPTDASYGSLGLYRVGAGASRGFSPAGLDYAAVTIEASNPPERIPN